MTTRRGFIQGILAAIGAAVVPWEFPADAPEPVAPQPIDKTSPQEPTTFGEFLQGLNITSTGGGFLVPTEFMRDLTEVDDYGFYVMKRRINPFSTGKKVTTGCLVEQPERSSGRWWI